MVSEPQFELGDRVRVVALLFIGGSHLLGREGEVIGVEDDEATGIPAYDVRWEDGTVSTFIEPELAPVPPAG